MIDTLIPEFLVKRFGRLWAHVIVIAAILLILFLGYQAVKHFFTAGLETQAEVSKAQTGAAIESGHNAVETVGNRQAAEEHGAATVQESQHEINNATDPGGITDAGLNGLHRVRGQAGSRPRR
jgi:hypothetical protein